MENPFESIIERLDRIEKLLVSLVPTDAAMTNAHFNKEILTLKELCSYLELSASHVYKLTSQNEIPFTKRSKRIYFVKKDIDDWLKKYRQTTKDEIEEMASNYLIRNPRKWR